MESKKIRGERGEDGLNIYACCFSLLPRFATGRIELLSSEGHVIRLVDMLKSKCHIYMTVCEI